MMKRLVRCGCEQDPPRDVPHGRYAFAWDGVSSCASHADIFVTPCILSYGSKSSISFCGALSSACSSSGSCRPCPAPRTKILAGIIIPLVIAITGTPTEMLLKMIPKPLTRGIHPRASSCTAAATPGHPTAPQASVPPCPHPHTLLFGPALGVNLLKVLLGTGLAESAGGVA